MRYFKVTLNNGFTFNCKESETITRYKEVCVKGRFGRAKYVHEPYSDIATNKEMIDNFPGWNYNKIDKDNPLLTHNIMNLQSYELIIEEEEV